MSKKNNYWYGYLDAGSKSSPVLADPGLSTDELNYRYLYNLNADRVIKYKSDIVNSKLRELSSDEKDVIAQLDKSYASSKKEFLQNQSVSNNTIKSTAQELPGKPVTEETIEPLDDIDVTDPIGDINWDEDSLESETV